MESGGMAYVPVEIDSRRQFDAPAERSNQLYRAVAETNRAIARSRDLDELLREACAIMVSEAAFPVAAIVRCGRAGATAAVIASAGAGAEEFVQELLALQVQRNDSLLSDAGDGQSGVVVVNDVETGPVCATARLACLRRGLRSYATFPLGPPGSAETRLAVFALQPGFFAGDTLEQVANMTRDLSLAVERYAERSARARAEQRLRDVVRRMSALVDAAPVAVFDVDAEQRVLGVWNPAAEQIFGWRRHEVLGRPLPVALAGEVDEARFAELRRRVGAGVAVSGLEIWCRRTDGTPVHLSVSASPITGIDGRPAILLVAENITARHEASEAMRRAHAELEARVQERTRELAEARDRAEEADRIKSAFLANMSQHLRMPLNSIIGLSSLLLSGGPGTINTEQGKQLAIIREAGERLSALIEGVLDLSRLQADNAPLPCERTPLRDMVLRIADTLRPQATRRGLTLETEIGPCVAIAEPRRLEQVITILVSNAIRHTQAGAVRVQCGTQNGVVAIAVEDSGPGISVTEQQRLFVPFSATQQRAAAAGDAGLNLAIARRLVEAMGGGIWVDSEPERGNVFTVRLEAADGDASTTGIAPGLPPA
jgi:PAS domain S-box-containing protein